MKTRKTINKGWCEYFKVTAKNHLANYGVIFVDEEYGHPIDNEYELDGLYQMYRSKPVAEQEALKQIYNNLNSGKRYGYYIKPSNKILGSKPIFSESLATDEDYIYIRYSHFGRSATKNTLKDLSWIINIIFQSTPTEFINTHNLVD